MEQLQPGERIIKNAQSMPDFDGPVVKIGAGMLSYWAITESGRAYVWGYDNNGSTA